MHARTMVLIAAGGFLGTTLRAGLEAALPARGWPWTTFAMNLTGALLLGLVSEYVIATRIDQTRRTFLRLAVGTGLVGSLTTYSSLALEALSLGSVWGVGYAAASVIGGIAFAATGIAVGAHLVGRAR